MLRSLAVRAARRVSLHARCARSATAAPWGRPVTLRPASQLQGGTLAVQQQRSFAEGAVATQTNVWDELGDLVTSDEGKRELAVLRSTYVDIAGKLASMAKVRSRPGEQQAQEYA